MLIPRGENYFNRCKSNIKFLEASMCEIPVIAQSFTTNDSPYDELDGKIGPGPKLKLVKAGHQQLKN